jgi:hypothetical protein
MAFAMMSVPVCGQGPGFPDRFASTVTGLNAYMVDHNNSFPPHQNPGDTRYNYYMPDVLTTPVPYLQSHQISDPFATGEKYNRFGYFNSEAFSSGANYQAILQGHGRWGMWSIGPSRINPPANALVTRLELYDATNGVLSNGVMFRNQRMLKETGSQ